MSQLIQDPVKNVLIDFYVDHIKKQSIGQQKLKINLIFYSIALIYLSQLTKYFANLFIKMDYQTKLLLVDGSVLLGGIEKFNAIYIICLLSFGLAMTIHFHLAHIDNIEILLHIYNLIALPIESSSDSKQNDLVNRLRKFTKTIYRIFSFSFIFFGKISINNFPY